MISNLPPGCSDRDIPGNRPEDVAFEEFADKMVIQIARYANFVTAKSVVLSATGQDMLTDWVWQQIEEAYNKGYSDAIIESAKEPEQDPES